MRRIQPFLACIGWVVVMNVLCIILAIVVDMLHSPVADLLFPFLGLALCGATVFGMAGFLMWPVLSDDAPIFRRRSRPRTPWTLPHARVVVYGDTSTRKKKRTQDDTVRVGPGDRCRVSGQGSQIAGPLWLETGVYVLRWRFAPHYLTSITLVIAATGERETLVGHRNGPGSTTFTVPDNERHLFEITVSGPARLRWSFEIEPV